ncbi:hypothetical protein K437DRAFT_166961 [Tilletiaria anomala UBC 951]|uniref:Uncharacterized protein n=1 Tax=Tilletiaria anomala (strain ATCC 24038 / CBS 436.72 / UBC 951) TaxID=1037660 RepID=A0A066VU22_TILAU|nr:uncharacterized protein K437DRAFT_166961 [Tilletiaria anomala UBC 951]KDN42065.1 hypothetical protein K437DRAFT_166961 [Tilletiaria anomala UBC 951]
MPKSLRRSPMRFAWAFVILSLIVTDLPPVVTKDMRAAFDLLKAMLSSKQTLKYPDFARSSASTRIWVMKRSGPSCIRGMWITRSRPEHKCNMGTSATCARSLLKRENSRVLNTTTFMQKKEALAIANALHRFRGLGRRWSDRLCQRGSLLGRQFGTSVRNLQWTQCRKQRDQVQVTFWTG